MSSTIPVSLIPKVELHRHLEGSVRFETAWRWAQRSPALKGVTREELRARIQFDGHAGYDQFLRKFETLRHLYYEQDAIAQVMREAVEDAALDNIRYLELRVSPDHFARQAGFDMEAIAALLFQSGQSAAREYGVELRYLCTITRTYPPETCERILDIALRCRTSGVIGFDLAGNEMLETGPHVRSLLKRAAREGLGISIHAGEAGSVARVREAIDSLHADRIAHGIASVKDPALLADLRRRNILLEVCPTSNLHTGSTASAAAHPLGELVRAGVPVAICTDDPAISRITLSDEYRFAQDVCGFPDATLQGLVLDAADGAFLPAPEKAALRARLVEEMAAISA